MIAEATGEDAPVAPLFAAMATEIHYTAALMGQASASGRLDPPLLMGLDEVTQICPVPLPQWLSDSGGKGIQVVAVVHGEAQLAGRWDDHGRQVVWDTSSVKVFLPGITDTTTLEAASMLCGQAQWKVRGQDHASQHDVATPDMIRQLPAGFALVIRGGYAPVIARLPRAWNNPAYRRARRHGLAPASGYPFPLSAEPETEPGLRPRPGPGRRSPRPSPTTRRPAGPPATTTARSRGADHDPRPPHRGPGPARRQPRAPRPTSTPARPPTMPRSAASCPSWPAWSPRSAAPWPKTPSRWPGWTPSTSRSPSSPGTSRDPVKTTATRGRLPAAPGAGLVEAHPRRAPGALAELRDWAERVYRPGYGHLAATLGPCWAEHDLCLYGLDIASQLWCALYLQPERSTGLLSAQAEYQARILPAIAAQLAAETTRCGHSPASGYPRSTP